MEWVLVMNTKTVGHVFYVINLCSKRTLGLIEASLDW